MGETYIMHGKEEKYINNFGPTTPREETTWKT
jgi:hypothetical protein